MEIIRNINNAWLQSGQFRYDSGTNVIVKDKIDAGVYTIEYDNRQYRTYLNKIFINNSDLVNIDQKETEEILNMVIDFCQKKDMYQEWNMKYKRGCLVYGVPGTGKTSIISKSIEYFINNSEGVCFLIKTNDELNLFHKFFTPVFREIEPKRMVMVIYEDIDGMINDTNSETLLINMLDGIGDYANIFNFATTNYTEKLSDRLSKRPGRFDRKIEVKSPNYEARTNFIRAKLQDKIASIDLQEWVKKSEGFTIAELNELIKSHFLCGLSLNSAIELIKGLSKTISSNQYNKEVKESIGFNNK